MASITVLGSHSPRRLCLVESLKGGDDADRNPCDTELETTIQFMAPRALWVKEGWDDWVGKNTFQKGNS